jgi:hypothetical protein
MMDKVSVKEMICVRFTILTQNLKWLEDSDVSWKFKNT